MRDRVRRRVVRAMLKARRMWPYACLIGLVVLAVALFSANLPTANVLEKSWAYMATVSVTFAGWGLLRSTQTWMWALQEASRNDRLDYGSAMEVAVSHNWTHVALLCVQLLKFQFGVFACFIPPLPGSTSGLTPVAINLTITLLLSEFLLTALNIYLVYARKRLERKVARIGGD